mmetsp:Transcript_40710/g.96397  ORF Transcript_40710/g.96397 Transcript_40710/m.96397 type:complete len:347 (+) Transcript_40710:167-1207(+)
MRPPQLRVTVLERLPLLHGQRGGPLGQQPLARGRDAPVLARVRLQAPVRAREFGEDGQAGGPRVDEHREGLPRRPDGDVDKVLGLRRVHRDRHVINPLLRIPLPRVKHFHAAFRHLDHRELQRVLPPRGRGGVEGVPRGDADDGVGGFGEVELDDEGLEEDVAEEEACVGGGGALDAGGVVRSLPPRREGDLEEVPVDGDVEGHALRHDRLELGVGLLRDAPLDERIRDDEARGARVHDGGHRVGARLIHPVEQLDAPEGERLHVDRVLRRARRGDVHHIRIRARAVIPPQLQLRRILRRQKRKLPLPQRVLIDVIRALDAPLVVREREDEGRRDLGERRFRHAHA